jgi:hypothetical protein
MRQRGKVGLIGCLPVKALMWSSAAVETEVLAYVTPRLGHRVIGSEIYLLVFDRPPKPLDKDIVTP